MIANYPLKSTQDNNLMQTFESYINSFYGPQAWDPVKGCFERMGQLRNGFEFQKFNVSLASDPVSLEKLEKSILEYLQYALICDSKFRFETYQQGCVNISFKWTDSFNPQKSMANTQLKYELCSLLYNLAVIYYFYGCNLMSRNQVDDRKEAIKKFRYGIWALTEFKSYISSVAPEAKNTHTDFSLENISVLENMMYGFVYASLYENLQPQQKQLGGIKNVIQLAGESAKFFGISKGIIDQIYGKKTQGYPSQLVMQIKASCDFNFAYFNGLTAQQMAIHHENLIEDEPLGNHMGWALSYLKKGQQLIGLALQDQNSFKVMSQDYQQRLQNLANYFAQNNPKAEQRNAQIYKHPIKTAEQLPQTQITFQNLVNLAGLKPQMLESKPQGTEGFDGFMNEDQIQMINECKGTTETRQLELNQALNQLVEMKSKAYLEHYVNNSLDVSSAQQGVQSSQQIPTSIQNKIDKINQLGGAIQLKTLVDSLKGFSVNCGMMINGSRQKLDEEAKFDTEMRNKYNQKWSRQESFKSNQEYYKKINDLDVKFKQAQNVDLEIMSKFERVQNDLVIAGKTAQEIAQLLPKSNDQEFFIRNQNDLKQLQELDRNMNDQIANIRNQINNLTNININYAQEVALAVQNNIPKDKIQETVLAKLFDGIEEINKQIALSTSTLGNICNIAIDLNKNRSSGTSQSTQQSEQISSGLGNVIDCFDEVQGGLNFYNQLLNRLSDQEKKISDYLMARDLESRNLQQLIGTQDNINQQTQQNFGNVGNYNNQVPIQNAPYQPYPQQPPQQQQQFYNPQNNTFNQGQSVFLGSQQQQPYQGQGGYQNPYANHQYNQPPK